MDLFLDISIWDLVNPEFYIRHGGIWLLLFIVFAETGLMVGFFLPGDSLLFIAGIYSQDMIHSIIPGGLGSDFADLLLLILFISSCGIAGNWVGYWFGFKSGPHLFNKEDNLIFKKKYLVQAKDFFDQYGSQAIVIARFLPTIRTFTPIVAGAAEMNRKKFMIFNIAGCLGWVVSMTVSGHYLEKILFEQFNLDIKNHLEIIVIGLIIITTLPFIWKYYKEKRKSKNERFE